MFQTDNCINNATTDKVLRFQEGVEGVIDLASTLYITHSGTSQVAINDHNVALYSGWNTKFLDLIAQVERGIGSLIQDIENYR